MKRIYFCMLAFLLSLSMVPYAQSPSPCDAVSIEVIAPQWQTGYYSYFGVRVSISQQYFQNITVSGYIWDGPDDHGFNTNHPYTLTIPAGSLSAETSVDFYQTGPAAEGAADIESVSPCPSWPTWQIKAANASNPYDSMGYRHNEGIIWVRTQTGSLKDLAVSYTSGIYSSVNHDTLVHMANEGESAALYDSTNYVPISMSSTAQGYSSQLISLVDNIQETAGIDVTVDSIKNLEVTISSSGLSANEKKVLLSAASVARYSIYYWLENIDSTGGLGMNFFPDHDFPSADFGQFTGEIARKAGGPSIMLNGPFAGTTNYNLLFKAGWFKKLLHVVVGDIVGMVAGALIGSQILPLCSPCTFAGALVGGMSGSLAAADSEGMLD